MKIKKIVTIILIIIWMITVFMFSSQQKEKSSKLSGEFTEAILRITHIDPKNEQQVEQIETVNRKLAHYSIYIIGGIIIYTHLNLYNTKTKNKIIITQVIRIFLCNNR